MRSPVMWVAAVAAGCATYSVGPPYPPNLTKVELTLDAKLFHYTTKSDVTLLLNILTKGFIVKYRVTFPGKLLSGRICSYKVVT